jgi:hypothetical protein
VRLQATLCPDAKESDDLAQDDRPAKKQNTCPHKAISTTFRNRCIRQRKLDLVARKN